LAELLERPSSRDVFREYSDLRRYTEILRLIHACRRQYRDYLEPLVTIHGEFVPYHVLVDDDVIHVIDFASSRVGHPFEDIALFVGFYDVVLPWRRVAGALRMRIDDQKRAFLDAYFGVGVQLGEAGEVAMRLARVHSAMRFAAQLVARETWRRRVFAGVATPLIRRSFDRVCADETAAVASFLDQSRRPPDSTRPVRADEARRPG
jgi:aminoglycoside phosphotransferase (APT) family kinase protein